MAKKKEAKFEIQFSDSKLWEICKKGLKERFGEDVPNAVTSRLEYELNTVEENNYSSYYLLASMLATEAKRLNYEFLFRGTISSTLIAYTSGISDINPMEKEYGGINIPFGTSREENGEVEPCIEMQCSPRFIIYAQSFLSKELPDYRCLTYSFSADELVPAYIFIVKEEDLPMGENGERFNIFNCSSLDFKKEYFYISVIGDKEMDLVRYNMYFNHEELDEINDDKIATKIWQNIKKKNIDAIDVDVKNYDELMAALGMSWGTWDKTPEDIMYDNNLPLSKMISTREDVYMYLVDKGISSYEAYCIMENVRKGKSLTKKYEKLIRDNNGEDWFIDICKRAKYLFPKAHIAQMIRRYAYSLNNSEQKDEENIDMSKIYFTVTGTNYKYGTDFIEPKMEVKLTKEPDNDYDKEAIKVEMEGMGQIGYVASTYRTIIGESMSAGRLYDKISDTAKGKVKYVLGNRLLCELLDYN